MKEIIVKDGAEYPDCPLRSDLKSCKAKERGRINECPILYTSDQNNDLASWSRPADCPLNAGPVLIRYEPEQKGGE